MKNHHLLIILACVLCQCSGKNPNNPSTNKRENPKEIRPRDLAEAPRPGSKKETRFQSLNVDEKLQNEGLLLAINDVTYLIDTSGVIDSINAIMLPTNDGFYYFKHYEYNYMEELTHYPDDYPQWYFRHRVGNNIAHHSSYKHLLDTIEKRKIIEN